MTKQELIKQAYGEYWEKVKDYVNEIGWLNTYDRLGDCGNTKVYHSLKGVTLDCMDSYHRHYCYIFRPKSLQGIENNNGWIKIESEEDLPKHEELCFVFIKDKNKICNDVVKYNPLNKMFTLGYDGIYWDRFSHYQPIEKPKPPLY